MKMLNRFLATLIASTLLTVSVVTCNEGEVAEPTAQALALQAAYMHDTGTLARIIEAPSEWGMNDGFSNEIDFRLRYADLLGDFDTVEEMIQNDLDELLDERDANELVGYHFGWLMTTRAAISVGYLDLAATLIDLMKYSWTFAERRWELYPVEARAIILRDMAVAENHRIMWMYAAATLETTSYDLRREYMSYVDGLQQSVVDLVKLANVEDAGTMIILDLANFVSYDGETPVDEFWSTQAAEDMIDELASSGFLDADQAQVIIERSNRDKLPAALISLLSELPD